MTINPKELVSLSEAAEIADRSRVTIWRWVRGGILPSIEISKRLFVQRTEVERVAKNRKWKRMK